MVSHNIRHQILIRLAKIEISKYSKDILKRYIDYILISETPTLCYGIRDKFLTLTEIEKILYAALLADIPYEDALTMSHKEVLTYIYLFRGNINE